MRLRRAGRALAAAALLLGVAACGGGAGAPATDGAVSFDRPVTIYIPTPAGGTFDIVARGLAPALEEELGTTVLPVNIEGGSGAVAAARLAADPANGHQMLIVSRTISTLPYTGAPQVDPLSQFAPVGVVVKDVAGLTVQADAPYDSAAEFVSYAEQHPGEVHVGTSGVGSVWHAAGLLLGQAAGGLEMEYVPYPGGRDAGNAVASGEVEATTISPAEAVAMVDADRAKMLGVMSEQRSPLFPDVPTLTEQGIDIEYAVWRGLVAKQGTPDAVLAALETAVRNAAGSQSFTDAMAQAGVEIAYEDAAALRGHLEQEDQLVQSLFGPLGILTTRPER
ncbi:tripartite tricarboxylate transporter substrate binding protein [Pseudonocardia sp. MH-G8]|uniref:tripartite tricarboxylate transporter substrate binding protein n=1 Tax=Pseudonocardia sp. MH-G8 TaxID=1854588 RepID=UPI000BA0C352|nr:tripartite tricarboxylate transporter substrate binding protein [Pseudonocardia sp. MH-G8]OZM75751.1 hypothetical protein CFP66_44675 [Pseudonocardia sp. MH-G8]